MAVNHEWRSIPVGLIELGQVAPRNLREEYIVLKDPYAAEAIEYLASREIQLELQGWARSFYTLEGHMAAIYKYRRSKVPAPTDSAWNQTVQAVLEMVRRWPKCKTKSYKDFDSVKWLRSSAAGFGYVGLKGDNDNYLRAKKTAITICEQVWRDPTGLVEALKNSTPDVAFTRTQLSQLKVKRKVRNVWGEAFHYVLIEGLFADNLIKYFMELDSFYFIGKDPLSGVPTLVTDMMKNYDYVFQFDWSAFDASVQEWEIRTAFSILEQFTLFDSPVEERIWRFIIELFIYRKVACPNGELLLKTLGIPSGSCFTNMIGSIINYLRIQYLFVKHTRDFACAYTHGDDSIVGTLRTQAINPKVFEGTCSSYHWELNADKTRVSSTPEEVEFLSRGIREGINLRDTLTCLRMLLYPEYEVTDGAISTLRAQSILFDSGLQSSLLFKVSQYLEMKFGVAKELPLQQQKWDIIEYESLRQAITPEQM
uniref:RNA-dependent RNA polymerase n=1 Tax=Interrupted club-moss deltapartitivirus TaxID=2933089 RepID=A0A9C7GWP1_9VIRU|nr:RNA-dependent RNA polymerase [Interrupted club-moss deltapartitivirus]CAI5383908.1 RNA-dependent RNA polymerase [Interrupted club-moss deltapartitivirus]